MTFAEMLAKMTSTHARAIAMLLLGEERAAPPAVYETLAGWHAIWMNPAKTPRVVLPLGVQLLCEYRKAVAP